MSVSSTKQTRDAVHEFTEDYFKSNPDIHPNLRNAEGLIRFYIEKIHNSRHGLIDNDAIDEGLVDASGDLGVDFIHKDGDHVLILQSKFHGKNSKGGATREDIHNFQTCLDRLLNPEWKGHAKLEEICNFLNPRNDNFTLIFLCLGKIENQAKTQSEKSVDFEFFGGLSDRVTIEYWDEKKITEEYHAAKTIGDEIDVPPATLYSAPSGKGSARTPIVELNTDRGKSYLLITEANQLIDIYRRQGVKDNLFSLNIRNYLGDTRNNKGIIETATKEPDNFFLFNNGISCLAKKVDLEKPNKITVHGLQVINGAQSVKALHKARRPDQQQQPLILIRITEIGKGYGEEGGLREDIIRYNNTQTIIKSADFRSNDPVQDDLKKKFSKLVKNGKKVKYVNKRTDPKTDPRTTKIRMEEFAKVIYAFLGDYTDFAHNTNFLFDAQKKGYKTIFGNGEEIYEKEMPRDEFEVRASIWWISDAFEKQRKIDRQKLKELDSEAWNALERKWLLLYAASVLLQKKLGKDWKIWIRKGHTGNWEFEGKETFGKDIAALYDISKGMLIMRYKEDFNNKQSFEHRNWFQSKATQEGLKNFIEGAGVRQLNLT